MKGIIRNFLFQGIALFVISLVFTGLTIRGGLQSYAIGGVVLAFLSFIVKPILGILSLPLNILTLGLFSFVINAFVLFLLTKIIHQVHVAAFTFHGVSFMKYSIPTIHFNIILSFIVISFGISFVAGFLNWLAE